MRYFVPLLTVALLIGVSGAGAQTTNGEGARGCAECSSTLIFNEGGIAQYDISYGAPCEPGAENCARCIWDTGCWNEDVTYTAYGATDPCLDPCPDVGGIVSAIEDAISTADYASILAMIYSPKSNVVWKREDGVLKVAGCSRQESKSIVLSPEFSKTFIRYADAAAMAALKQYSLSLGE